MAKRLKLNDGLHNDIESAMNLQKLLTAPDAEKLQRLDHEMTDVLQKKNLSVDEKVRMFEEKLGAFRYVQDKIVRSGSLSILSQPSSEGLVLTDEHLTVLKETITNVISELLNNKSAGKSSDLHDLSNMESTLLAISGSPSPQPADKSLLQGALQESAEMPKPVTKKSLKSAAKGSPQKLLKSNSSLELHDSGSAKRLIKKLLQSEGMRVAGVDRVSFPITDMDERTRLKRASIEYKNVTLTKAINHMIAKNPSKIPPATTKVVDRIYQSLRNGVSDFEQLLTSYPNLQEYHKLKGSGLAMKWVTA